MHSFKLKGSLAMIHAITQFAMQWQQENESPDTDEVGQNVVEHPSVEKVSGTNVPLVDPAEVVKPATTRKRSSGKKPEYTESTRPIVTEAAASPALPDWLQPTANNTAPQAAPNPFGGAAPSGDAFTQAAEAALPWLTAAPTPPAFVAPEPVIQQHPALLDQIAEVGRLIGTDDRKRAKAMEYLTYLGVDSIAKIAPERQTEALSTLQQIYSGQIAS